MIGQAAHSPDQLTYFMLQPSNAHFHSHFSLHMLQHLSCQQHTSCICQASVGCMPGMVQPTPEPTLNLSAHGQPGHGWCLQLRGRLVLLYELLLCGGMLGSLLADRALMHLPNNWRWMVGLPIIPAAVLAGNCFTLLLLLHLFAGNSACHTTAD